MYITEYMLKTSDGLDGLRTEKNQEQKAMLIVWKHFRLNMFQREQKIRNFRHLHLRRKKHLSKKIKYFIDFKKTWPKGHVFLLRTQECFENFLVKCSYLIYNILNQKLEKVKKLEKNE